MIKEINNIMTSAYEQIKEYLSKTYPNLYFYISPIGNITCWVRTTEGKDGTGIKLPYNINVGQILFHQWRYLQELNKKVALVRDNPKEFFYCTECGEVKPVSEYEDFVMAANYCKECAKKPDIANLIAESHKAGFYD